MAGWISLHRSIRKHWLYEEDRKYSRFEAWVDLLLEANHDDEKIMFDGSLITVKRSENLTSLRKLSEKWRWSITKVNSFLKILEDDDMIAVKKDTKKTVITIVNYDFYQNKDLEKRHRKNAEKTQKENRKETEVKQKETNNKVNKDNKTNKDNKRDSKESPGYNSEVFDILSKRGVDIKNPNVALKISNKMDGIDDIQYLHEAINIAERKGVMKDAFVYRVIENWFDDGKTTYADLVTLKQKQNNTTPQYGTPNSQEQKDAYSHFDF